MHLRQPIGTTRCLYVRLLGLNDVDKGLHKTDILNFTPRNDRENERKKILCACLDGLVCLPHNSPNSAKPAPPTSADVSRVTLSSKLVFASSATMFTGLVETIGSEFPYLCCVLSCTRADSVSIKLSPIFRRWTRPRRAGEVHLSQSRNAVASSRMPRLATASQSMAHV
jgi:hypothetical protein